MSSRTPDNLFLSGGELGRRMQERDWQTTPLGPTSSWPQTLTPALSICLGSSLPIAIYWGPSFALLYNDAWRPLLGNKHPWALGRAAAEVWPEMRDITGPMFKEVVTTGETASRNDQLLPMHRLGYTEECYFDYTFSPIRGEGSRVEGIFNTVVETTFRVISERRTRVLRELADQTIGARSIEDACRVAAEAVGGAALDVPFLAIYLSDHATGQARLVATGGSPIDSRILPASISLDDQRARWPLAQADASRRVEVVSDLPVRFETPLPGGPWPEPTREAFIAPFFAGPDRPSGFLVIGASPRRAIDDEYRLFVERAASHVSVAASSAAAFETERRNSEALAELLDFSRSDASQRLLVSINDAVRNLHEPTRVITEIATRIGQHFEVSRCVYGELDPLEEYTSITGQYASGVQPVAGRHRLADFGADMVRDLKAGNTVVIPDVTADERTNGPLALATLEGVETRSLLAVPLIKIGRFVGLFVVAQREQRVWASHEIALAERLAERMWFSVENSRAENALRESRDVLSLAMRGGRMGAWSRDLRTGEVWWSRELEQIFDVEEGAFSGNEDGFFAFVHRDDRAAVETAVTTAINRHEDYLVEFRFAPAHGTWRWMEGRGRAVYAADGTPLTLYGVGIDITERKSSEEALAAARDAAGADAARLSLALEAARLGDWSWDAATDVVTMSARAAELFAIGAGAQVTWSAMRNLLHPDDRERARIAVEESIAQQHDYWIEYRLINGGRERWVLASGRPQFDRAGNVLGMFGVVQDLSQSRLLVKLDDSVRPLIDPDQITFTAARLLGEHLQVNRCAYAIVESDEDTFVVTGNYTNGVASIVGRYTFTQFGHESLRLLRAGQAYVVNDSEKDHRIDDETRRRYQAAEIRAVICVPILKSGRFVAAMAVHTKTGRHWSSVEVGLVQQVASRCWESIERARVERERLGLLEAAEAANRAKDEFLAMLGHELRNPLSPILTALQLMRLRGISGAERERVVIERQVEHLTRLVDDLLDVSRIAGGKVELKLQIIELSEVVARALEVTGPLLEERQHLLEMSIPRSGLPVEGDSARLTQIVTNLMTNAAKYTPPGGRIQVSGVAESNEIVLRVKDNGIGITKGVLPHVFDLFVQSKQSLDRARGGLGLGLAIVKSLVERHGGRVSVESGGTGRGSEFVVRLPLATAPPMVTGEHVEPTFAVRRAAGGIRILIVDDNEDAAEMLAEALRTNGHDTRVAHDAAEALQIAATTPLDVAFLDIGLPVIDGYELAATLKELPGFESVRLIAVTGYGQESDRRRSEAAGFEHHIVKPVDIDALETLIVSLRDRRTVT